MIYRCTARFIKSYDHLPPVARTSVARVLCQNFTDNPRMPSADAHIVRGARREVYTLHIDTGLRMTYAYCSDPRHANDFVCELRNVGMVLETA